VENKGRGRKWVCPPRRTTVGVAFEGHLYATGRDRRPSARPNKPSPSPCGTILQTRREDPVNESSAALFLLLFGLNLLLLLLDYGPSLFGCRPRRGIVALCHPLPVLRKPQ